MGIAASYSRIGNAARSLASDAVPFTGIARPSPVGQPIPNALVLGIRSSITF